MTREEKLKYEFSKLGALIASNINNYELQEFYQDISLERYYSDKEYGLNIYNEIGYLTLQFSFMQELKDNYLKHFKKNKNDN